MAWMTTVGDDGTPQPNPVWFLWDEDGFLVFSGHGPPTTIGQERKTNPFLQ